MGRFDWSGEKREPRNRDRSQELSNKGLSLVQSGRLDEGIAVLKEAIEFDPDNEVAHINLGFAYDKKGWHDKARTEFRRAVELDPRNAVAHGHLGAAYYCKGWFEQAIAEFKRAVELEPDYAMAHFNLASAYYSSGRFDLAWKHVRIAEKLGAPIQNVDQLVGLLGKVSKEPDDEYTSIDENVRKSRATALRVEKKPEYEVGDTITDPSGRALYDFEVRDVLKGGFGIVYIVYDRQIKDVVAVKSFQDRFFKAGDKEADQVVKAFYHEAKVWVRFGEHENIVEAFFVIPVDYKPHIVMEYVDGGSLRDMLDLVDLPKALFFAIQFCDGMIYVNSVDLGEGKRGIVHRDIKPENIMLTKKGILKITDFGLVKALGAPSAERPVGTPEYMAPEQFRSMDVDTRADIYSFGVVFYQMLTGRQPFWTGDEEERWVFCEKCHKETDPLRPRQIDPSIPEELETIVLKCLEKRPEDRYQSFEDLREELMEVYRNRFGQIPEVNKRIRNLTATQLTNRGISLLGLGASASAQETIQFFDRALEIDPRHANAWFGKGSALILLDRFKEAIECFDRALEINPSGATAWNAKGKALNKLGKPTEAIECFDRALKINARYTDAWLHMGVSWVIRGLPSMALPLFDRALEIDSGNADAWVEKGIALNKLGRREEAIECYNKALEINPTNALLWLSKGKVLYELGAREEAERCARKALEIDPSLGRR